MSRTVHVLQHVAPEGPGRIATALAARGLPISLTAIHEGHAVPASLDGVAGLVVMGGPMGVYEADRFPHLAAEQRLIEQALRASVPVLGVCLGAQLLAATLGARVAPGLRQEIGWLPVTREPGARGDALFGGLPGEFTALHWHGDVFELPAGSTLLARSELTAHQAFRHGDSAWGVLFHLEATASQVESMARTFAADLTAAGVDAAALLRATPAADRAVAPLATLVFDAFAERVARGAG